jgi:hypothetical protein
MRRVSMGGALGFVRAVEVPREVKSRGAKAAFGSEIREEVK